MRAVILAAGVGSRLGDSIGEIPKCMVDIGEETLISYTINLLQGRGIDEIVVVSGYKSDSLSEHLAPKNVQIVNNPFYKVTNSIASLWFAQDFIDEGDTIIINGDLFIEPGILDALMEDPKHWVMVVDRDLRENADYKFKIENGCVVSHGKEIPLEDSDAEYIGIAKISSQARSEFVERLNYLVEGQQYGLWWENVLYSFIQDDEVYVRDVEGAFWSEVDVPSDYERILGFREDVGFSVSHIISAITG